MPVVGWAVRLALLVVGVVGQPTSSFAASPTDSLSARAVVFALRYDDASPSAADAGSQPRDRWLAMDKAKHVGGSMLWTVSTQYVLVVKGDVSDAHALPWSVASAASVGVAKEVYDRYRGPTAHFSWKDLAADAVGIALGTGLIVL